MKSKAKKKVSYIPVVVVIISLILLGVAEGVDNFPLQTKIGFVGKVGLVIGMIGLWLYTILPSMGNKEEAS